MEKLWNQEDQSLSLSQEILWFAIYNNYIILIVWHVTNLRNETNEKDWKWWKIFARRQGKRQTMKKKKKK